MRIHTRFSRRQICTREISDIIELQKQDPLYHSVMYDLLQGQLSWLMRACVDCLPTYANVRRWNKVLSDKCALCNRRETLRHTLTGCSVAVDKPQFRYDLRHDSILLHIMKQMHASKSQSGKRMNADIDVTDFKLPGGGTIPP